MTRKIITNLLISLILLFSISLFARESEMALHSGEKFKVRLALSEEERNRGLSGIRPEQFSKNEGMLFVFQEVNKRAFWMPDTYFDLDIFFLNNALKVVGIARGMKAHPTFNEPPAIDRTPIYEAMYVLELRSDSPLAKKIQMNSNLTWKEANSFLKKGLGTHPRQ